VTFFWQLLLTGVATGALYALMSMGFVLVYRATSVVNFAIGEFLLVGGYVTFTLAHFLPLPLAMLGALPVAFLVGVGVERAFVRPLIGRSVVAVIMATIGLALTLDGAAQLVWGPDQKYLSGSLPPVLLTFGELILPPRAFWSLAISLPVALGLIYFLQKSRWGVLVRAVSESEVAALAMGIPAPRIVTAVWGLSAALAAVGGALLAGLSGVGPHLVQLGLMVFPVTILGGLESVGGALAAGLIVGVAEALSKGYLEAYLPGISETVPFIIVLIVVLVRPYGLFGRRDIERV